MNIELILKGVLLYVTFIVCMLVMACIDSIHDDIYFVEAVLIVAGLIFWCKKVITEEEFKILLLDNLFNNDDLK